MRSVGGDHDAFTHWLSLHQDDLARGVVLDTIDLDTPVCGDDFIAWWASALRATPRAMRKGTSLMILLTA
jgi:hypothetical protein